jgi:AmiR/NasT family two-component response regulator
VHATGEPGPRPVAVVYAHAYGVAALTESLTRLGYDVRQVEGGPDDFEWRWEDGPPSVALVGRQDSPDAALALIGRLAHEGGCPVVAVVPELDPAYVREAGRRGAYGVVLERALDTLPAAIEIACARFLQYRGLQDAFTRRAMLEQAKGILMAEHGIDQNAAFDLLRNHARRNSTKILDVAEAVVHSHSLLATSPQQAPST